MRVIENPQHSRITLALRVRRTFRMSATTIANAFLRAWAVAFPMPPLDDPTAPTPLISKSGILREGAILSENVDAVSDKRIA
jgi:hypothetical protein